MGPVWSVDLDVGLERGMGLGPESSDCFLLMVDT